MNSHKNSERFCGLYWARALILAAAVGSSVSAMAADEIVYGSQLYRDHGAFVASKLDGDSMMVGGQFNGWAYGGGSWVFGMATEAVAFGGSPILVGLENAVGSLSPGNMAVKVGNNAVFKCHTDLETGCITRNNENSFAYLVTAQPETGFESALRVGRDSIADSALRHATVIDAGELDPSRLESIVFVRLPGGREVTFGELVRLLEHVAAAK